MGVTNPEGVKKYFVAAFPSACGKTNLSMLRPSGLEGYKVECIGKEKMSYEKLKIQTRCFQETI